MFLVRSAFWLSVVVMLLPGDPESGTEAPRVGAVETLFAARAAIADLSGFCNREPQACETGGAALAVFGEKARYGANLLFQTIGTALSTDGTVPTGIPEELRGTLTPDDRAPSWRGEGGQPV